MPVAPEVPIAEICPQPEGMLAVVTANYLNVRNGPRPNNTVVDTLEKCDQVFLTGQVAQGYIWVELHNRVPTSSTSYSVNSTDLDMAVPVTSLTVRE